MGQLSGTSGQNAIGSRRESSAESREPRAEPALVVVALAVLAIAATTTAATATAATAASSATTAAATTTTTTAPTIATATATATTAFTSTAVAAAGRCSAARATIKGGHVLGLRSLLSLTDFELDFLAFLELPEAPALNGGEVHETILATIIRRDETVPLLGVEPLHYPCRAHRARSPVSLVVLLSPPECGPIVSASLQLLLQYVWTVRLVRNVAKPALGSVPIQCINSP